MKTIIGNIIAKPNFLKDLTFQHLQTLNDDEVARLLEAENLYFKQKTRTVYYLAVNGSKTRDGGLVRASNNNYQIEGISIACVGDEVLYADGTTSKIISGAGEACVIAGKPAALVGSPDKDYLGQLQCINLK
ncbi:TPA: PAAR domain-containing protein [Acinetobacter baumannii]|uniref:PAAR domain-containing protein n=1 Tax=Acinetobacter baumannii TaxID=470 RepID=UPI002AB485CE|nr:PAAR domain-containing protein [Acinetobacter baumannii]